MTTIEFLYYKHPELKHVPISEVNHLLSGEGILELMQDYANHIYGSTPLSSMPFQPPQYLSPW